MNLKSFGCSFIFGSELSDDGRDGPYALGSSLTWPALYAKDLNYGYQCYARPGAGNLQIAERTLSQLACNEHALYVIGWTWIDRFDYTITDSEWPGTPWKTIMPIDDTAVAKTYYRDLHSQYRDKLTSLMNIRLVIDTLKQKNYPFIMTYMDDLLFENQWHTTLAVNELQEYIRPHMTKFENSNFLEWSQSKGYSISAACHPLEDAHRAAFEYIKTQSFS